MESKSDLYAWVVPVYEGLADHTWVTEKMDWVKLDDGLLQYPQMGP